MRYLLAILILLAILMLFLLLTAAENRTGKRVLARRRYSLDAQVARAAFVVRHVDWLAFARDITQASFDRVLHDVAHGSLLGVRALERELTRLVRVLRMRRDEPFFALGSREQPTRLQTAITYVKKSVRRSRKEDKRVDSD